MQAVKSQEAVEQVERALGVEEQVEEQAVKS